MYSNNSLLTHKRRFLRICEQIQKEKKSHLMAAFTRIQSFSRKIHSLSRDVIPGYDMIICIKFFYDYIIQGCLRYKTFLCSKIALDV